MNSQQLNKKLKNITQDIKAYNPEKVILFGSCARKDFSKDSDIDLLIIKRTNKPMHQRIKDVYRLVYKQEYFGDSQRFPGALDIIVYTPSQFKKELKLGDFFVKEIIKQGRVIYEKGK